MLKAVLKRSPVGPFLIKLKKTPRAIRGRVDKRRLSGFLPDFDASLRASAEACQRLLEPYKEYTATVSGQDTAISFEAIVFTRALLDRVRPAVAVDLGSGFSSYVLRQWAKECGSRTELWSVDDNTEWLRKTREFLIRKDVDPEHVISLEDFKATTKPKQFDFVFYDLGFMQTRFDELRMVASRTSDKGWLILDDVHKPGYLELIRGVFDADALYSLHSYTEDQYTRYSYLVAKGEAFSALRG